MLGLNDEHCSKIVKSKISSEPDTSTLASSDNTLVAVPSIFPELDLRVADSATTVKIKPTPTAANAKADTLHRFLSNGMFPDS